MNRLASARFCLALILIGLCCLTTMVIATGYVWTRLEAATDRLTEVIDLDDRSSRWADQVRPSLDDPTRMVGTNAVTDDGTLEDARQERRSLSLTLVCLLWGMLIVSPLVAFAGYGYHRVSYAELKSSEARLQALLNASPKTIALLGRDGNILGINESGARRFGSTADSLTGRSVYDALPANVAQSRKAHIDRVFATASR